MSPQSFSTDCLEFITLLNKYDVRWVIVGGEAVIYYGYVRLTGDVDFFYANDEENINKLWMALNDFWDNNIPGNIQKADLKKPGYFIQFGIPPNRIDLMNKIDGVKFEEVWKDRVKDTFKSGQRETHVYFISLDHLIKNKSKSKRPKDREDLKYLKARKNSNQNYD
jgi:hypothetical protein